MWVSICGRDKKREKNRKFVSYYYLHFLLVKIKQWDLLFPKVMTSLFSQLHEGMAVYHEFWQRYCGNNKTLTIDRSISFHESSAYSKKMLISNFQKTEKLKLC